MAGVISSDSESEEVATFDGHILQGEVHHRVRNELGPAFVVRFPITTANDRPTCAKVFPQMSPSSPTHTAPMVMFFPTSGSFANGTLIVPVANLYVPGSASSTKPPQLEE